MTSKLLTARYLWLFAMTGLLVACGPASRGGPAYSLNTPTSTVVTWVGTFTDTEKSRCLSAWEHHKATWARNRGKPAPFVTHLEIHYSHTAADTLPGMTAQGTATWPINEVKLMSGFRQELPWAYHELQHLEVWDSAHSRPEWSVWDLEQRDSLLSWPRYFLP